MSKIKVARTRLSFPSLFKTAKFGEEDTGKFEATFVLDKVKHAKEIKLIQDAMAKMLADAKMKVPADKLCLKDGDESSRPEFAGAYTIKASTKKRPVVIGKDRAPLVEGDNIIYAGCFVNCIFSLWLQDNKFGKRVNAQLDGVQFAADGDAFGDAGIAVDEFDAFGDAADGDEDYGF